MKYRDVDHAEVAMKMRTGAYAGVAVGAIAYFGALFIADRGGAIGASIYQPSGSSTPAVREYSLADSLVARGRIDEAAEAYQLLSEDYPGDPEPRLRHARLLRDKAERYEEAAQIFKSILGMAGLKPETELVALRELVELCTHKLHAPQRALPYLARISEKFAGTPTAQWARAEALEIKQQMKQDHDRDVG